MDVCHLSAPCETPPPLGPPRPIPYLALCGSEDPSSWFWAFSRHVQLHGSACLLRGILQQKGNRCALMSTVDYSRKTLREKCAPAAQTDWALRPPSVSDLPDEQVSGGDKPRSWQLPVQHRRQRHSSTCPHPLSVHVTAALLSPQTRREHRPRVIGFSSGWVALARDVFEWWLDVIYAESRYKQQLSTCAGFAGAQVRRFVRCFRVITWIVKGFQGPRPPLRTLHWMKGMPWISYSDVISTIKYPATNKE